MSYSDDLALLKEKQKKILLYGFSFFVLLPTFLVFFYYGLVASPLYTSHNQFTVTVEKASGGNMSGGLGMLLSSATGSSPYDITEAHIVKTYIHSVDMIQYLRKEINIDKIFRSDEADFFSESPKDAPLEIFQKYYLDRISLFLNEKNGVITMDVDAFTPQEAHLISEAIFKKTEQFVNERSNRIQKDSLEFSENFLKEAEDTVLKDTITLSNFRNKNKNFDPTLTATSVLGITSTLEEEISKTQTEIATLSNFLKKDNTKIQALQAKQNSLQKQIQVQSERLASKEGSTLANLAQQYEALKLKADFSVKRYGLALASYEKARTDIMKQKKYLIRVVGPTLPETSLKPNVWYNTLTVFFMASMSFLIVSLMFSALRDHIKG